MFVSITHGPTEFSAKLSPNEMCKDHQKEVNSGNQMPQNNVSNELLVIFMEKVVFLMEIMRNFFIIGKRPALTAKKYMLEFSYKCSYSIGNSFGLVLCDNLPPIKLCFKSI